MPNVRVLLVLAILIGALYALDAYSYDGYYRTGLWNQANYQAAKLDRDITEWVNGELRR